MAIQYTIVTYTSTGTRTAYVSDALDIAISRAVNGVDMLRMVLGGTSPAVP